MVGAQGLLGLSLPFYVLSDYLGLSRSMQGFH